MYKIFFFLFVVACFSLMTEAQLTFTSSWGGKRSMMGPIPCRSDEALANIYKMIQTEAERMILCQKP